MRRGSRIHVFPCDSWAKYAKFPVVDKSKLNSTFFPFGQIECESTDSWVSQIPQSKRSKYAGDFYEEQKPSGNAVIVSTYHKVKSAVEHEFFSQKLLKVKILGAPPFDQQAYVPVQTVVPASYTCVNQKISQAPDATTSVVWRPKEDDILPSDILCVIPMNAYGPVTISDNHRLDGIYKLRGAGVQTGMNKKSIRRVRVMLLTKQHLRQLDSALQTTPAVCMILSEVPEFVPVSRSMWFSSNKRLEDVWAVKDKLYDMCWNDVSARDTVPCTYTKSHLISFSAWLDELSKKKSHVLFKPCTGRRGGGIFVRSPEAVVPELVAKVEAGRLIAQEFVPPWLTNDDGILLPRDITNCRGFKFDFRIYVAATSTGLLYLSDVGRVKFCSEPFDLSRTTGEGWSFSLLANGFINSKNTEPSKKGGVTLTLEEFKARNKAVFDDMWSQVQGCLHKQHLAGYRAVTAMKPFGASPAAAAASASKAAIVTPQMCGSVLSCSLMGIDIMFTSTDGSPRVLEWNRRPESRGKDRVSQLVNPPIYDGLASLTASLARASTQGTQAPKRVASYHLISDATKIFSETAKTI